MVVRQTDDPEVVVVEIEHHGRSQVLGGPYRFRAVGVVRVRDGKLVAALSPKRSASSPRGS